MTMHDHPSNQPFRTTQWSVIRKAAGRDENANAAREGLAELSEAYWPPLYTFLRRQGFTSADSEDMVQGFFATLLERDDLSTVDPERGRFRTFLLAALKHYVSNRRNYERAAKRGGRQCLLPLRIDEVEQQIADLPGSASCSDAAFDRQWAVTLLDRVQSQLLTEQSDSRRAIYQQLSVYLTANPAAASYQEMGDRLNMTTDAIKMAVSRMRSRFREILRVQIALTVDDAHEMEDEIRYLISVLR